MPYPINPDDYNIDKLNTGFLGPILTTDFRDYILGFNLDNINPEIVSHGYNLGGLNDYVGNEFNPNPHVQDLPGAYTSADLPSTLLGNVTPWESNQVMNLWGSADPYSYQLGNSNINTSAPYQGKNTYTVQAKTLTDPGNVSIWYKSNSGSIVNVKDIREDNNLDNNKYGPELIKDLTDPLKVDSAGYVQYKTYAGGDFRASILGQQLGFGAGAGIEFDSDLADIGKEQRKFNIKERIKLNFIGDTIGKINADPLGLLAGQDLFTRDYTITQGPGFGGKAAEFTQSLLGFNYPSSILPSWLSVPGTAGGDVNEDLLNNTASGTKSLLYDAIVKNKWGPRFMKGEELTQPKTKSKVGNFIKNINDKIDTFNGAGEQPSTIRYTDAVTTDVEAQEKRDKSLVDKLNTTVADTVNKLMGKINPSVIPVQSEQPDKAINPIDGDEAYSFEKGYDPYDMSIQQEYDSIDNDGLDPHRFIVKNDKGIPDTALMGDNDIMYWENRSEGGRPIAKRGLLKYTQKLIDGDKNMIGRRDGARYIGIANDTSNVSTADKNRHKVFSQGNRIQVEGSEGGKIYCRSWSHRNPYSKIEDTIRHRQSNNLFLKELGILEDNGMPKIVPYYDEYSNWTESKYSTGEPSKYMLSLENLAWQNTREFNALPNVEKGPNGGRLMWFPPYDINFTDNSSVNWESTQFIGRGEPIYTYNHAERTGTLSFTIITDHPSSLNQLRLDTKANLERYFAGCEDLTNTAFGDVDGEEIPEPETVDKPKPMNEPTGETPKVVYYFENADKKPKISPGRNVYTDVDQGYESDGLNAGFFDSLQKMTDFLLTPNGKRYKIIVRGYTSALNVNDYNQVLGKDRADSLRAYFTSYLTNAEIGLEPVVYETFDETAGKKEYPKEINWKDSPLRWAETESMGEVAKSGQDGPITSNQTQEEIENIVNDPVAKLARKAVITLEYNPDIDALMLEKATNQVEEINKERQAEYNRKQKDRQVKIDAISERLAREMVNESTYFNKMEVEDSFVFDSLREKVKFFHPAFHSMTPEGLNSRLTFLKQCTRQGPNINKGEPQNMAFGRPPICVLRIGDFYHTKIVIDSVNLSYEPLLWDLNPEGVGVQPMIAKVDLNFKFIGGSSLGGPINQLQNAVSFNFFANTSVYNKRKSVTVSSSKDLPGRKGTKTETFDYGSWKSPSEIGSELPKSEINLDKRDNVDDLIEEDLREYFGEVTDKGKTDPKLEETKKAIKDAEESGEDKFSKAADVVKFTHIGTRYGGGSITIVTKTLIEILPEEKDNWNMIMLEFDTRTPGSEADRVNEYSSIASDGKSATFTDYEGNIEAEGGESGTYWYKFYVIVNNVQTGEQRIFTEEVTNKIP
jgi:hypothetical protein